MTAARCTAYPHLDFFSSDPTEQQAAQAVCAGCDLRAKCLAGARARDEPWGVWGGEVFGVLPDDVMVVAEARVRVTVAAVHGNRGTYLHCTAGEDGGKCTDCRRANSEYQSHYRHDGPAVTRAEIVDLQIPLFEGVSA